MKAAPLVLLGCVFLSGCSPPVPEVPEVRYLIGVSQANTAEPWRLSVIADIEKEAASLPGLRIVVTDASDSVVQQSQDLDRLVDLGCDLVIVSPADAAGMRPAIDRTFQKVPVIVIDRAVEGYNYSLYLGPDNRRIGREAGNYVARLLAKKPGRVLEVLGRRDSPPSLDRSRGFRDGLSDTPQIQIVQRVEADWLQDKAEDAVSPILAGDDKFDVIFAQNDAMALGAWLGAQKAGRNGPQIIGIDGLSGPDGGIELVRRGVLSATFIVPTGGKEAVDYAVDILKRTGGIPKKIILRTSLVTAEAQDTARTSPVYRPNGGRPRLGFSQVGSESVWRAANSTSIREAAVAAGVDLEFDQGDGTQAHQIETIRRYIRERVDVIAFSPIVETGWDEVLGEARLAGIPIILTDRKVITGDPSLWLTYIGSDFEEEGRRAATWLLSQFKKGAPPIGIVEIAGTEGSSPVLDRHRGFLEVLAGRPDVMVTATINSDFTREGGRTAMADFLARPHPEFTAVFSHNDDMALGAIKSLKAAGIEPGTQVVIVSIDAIRDAFEAMLRGELNCTVECTPLLGPQLMKIFGDYVKGKTLPWQYISSEDVFPAEQAPRALANRRY